jgi:hypothetical protein
MHVRGGGDQAPFRSLLSQHGFDSVTVSPGLHCIMMIIDWIVLHCAVGFRHNPLSAFALLWMATSDASSQRWRGKCCPSHRNTKTLELVFTASTDSFFCFVYFS